MLHCPIQKDCKAYLEGDPSKLPVQPKKKERRKEDKIYYVLVCKDKIHLVQRPKTGLLSGLYGFDEKKPEHIVNQMELKEHIHVFSHVEWIMKGVLCEVDSMTENFIRSIKFMNSFPFPVLFYHF